MDPEFVLSVISRWIHVGTAVVLVGGTAFMRFVVIPSAPPGSTELFTAIRNRWKKFVHAGIALFLLSGFYNYFQAMPSHKGDGLYHALIGTKIILAFAIFFIASTLVGRSAGTQKFRDASTKWKSVVVLLAALIIAASGFLKVRGVPVKLASPESIEVPPVASSTGE